MSDNVGSERSTGEIQWLCPHCSSVRPETPNKDHDHYHEEHVNSWSVSRMQVLEMTMKTLIHPLTNSA